MVWFKNYGQMGEMVRLLKDLGFVYYNPFFRGKLKEPETFDAPWLYFDPNKKTYLLGIGAINYCDLSSEVNVRFKNASDCVKLEGDLYFRFLEDNTVTYNSFDLVLWNNKYLIIKKYWGSSNIVNIPSSYKGIPVKEIGEFAFSNNSLISKVIIPEGIEILESRAFENCKNLEEINLPRTLRRIEEGCFMNCDSLTYIFIPKTLLWIEDNAFDDNYKLLIALEDYNEENEAHYKDWDTWHGEDYNVLYGVKEGVYQNGAYKYVKTHNGICIVDYEGMESTLTLPIEMSGEKIIGASIHNHYLKSIKVPAAYKAYEFLRFSSCDNLETVIVNEGIDNIRSRLCYHLKSLKIVIFPKSVDTIEEETFYDCPNLKAVYIPNEKCFFEPGSFVKTPKNVVIYGEGSNLWEDMKE